MRLPSYYACRHDATCKGKEMEASWTGQLKGPSLGFELRYMNLRFAPTRSGTPVTINDDYTDYVHDVENAKPKIQDFGKVEPPVCTSPGFPLPVHKAVQSAVLHESTYSACTAVPPILRSIWQSAFDAKRGLFVVESQIPDSKDAASNSQDAKASWSRGRTEDGENRKGWYLGGLRCCYCGPRVKLLWTVILAEE